MGFNFAAVQPRLRVSAEFQNFNSSDFRQRPFSVQDRDSKQLNAKKRDATVLHQGGGHVQGGSGDRGGETQQVTKDMPMRNVALQPPNPVQK